MILAALACALAPKAPEGALPPGAKPDVVVVTLDTTRADRIGAYGHAAAGTDSIDALARAGTMFRWAYSPLPLTIPAHATMFTGLLPYHHHVRANGDNVLAPSFTTLAEHLKGQGWATGASVAAFVTTRQWGFAQGFDAFFDSLPEEEGAGPANAANFWHHERPGSEVVDDALAWLAGQPAEQPVFLWVHLYDAHFPYAAPPAVAERFPGRPYDAELAYVDDQVGRLVAAFAGRQVVWALVGDHGEALGEHQELSHGLYAYNPTARVPFVLSGAGVPARIVDEPVSTADLTPTLLRHLNLEVPPGLDGVPQPGSPTVPYVESYQLAERFGIAPHRAVVAEGYKLIATPRPELYDQRADPGEQQDLAAQKPEVVARLRALLDTKGAGPPTASTTVMDASTLAQLAALGYVAAGGAPEVDYAALVDPKDKRDVLARLVRLDGLAQSRPSAEALAEMDALIAELPGAFELRMRRVNLLGREKDEARLRAELADIATAFPGKSRPWVILAGLSMRARDAASALQHAERALSIEPRGLAPQEAVVEALFALDRDEEAVTRGRAFLVENPTNYGVAASLGRHFLWTGDLREAEKHLRIAIEGPNPRRAARAQLAVLAAAAGFRGDAIQFLEAELADYPGNEFARRLLARFYGEESRWLDQKAQLEVLRRSRPKDPLLLVSIAQCDFNMKDYRVARRRVDEALLLAPENPDVLLLHANLLAKEGRRDEGAKVYERAAALKEAELRSAGKLSPPAAPRSP